MTGGPAAAEWVSVSDAMPKIGAQCLIRQEKCAFFTCACFEDLGNGTYGWSATFDAGDKRHRPVTHWALIHQPEEFEHEPVTMQRVKHAVPKPLLEDEGHSDSPPPPRIPKPRRSEVGRRKRGRPPLNECGSAKRRSEVMEHWGKPKPFAEQCEGQKELAATEMDAGAEG